MDDLLKEALEIVKAQAAVRIMTEEEITSMVQKLSCGLKSLNGGAEETAAAEAPVMVDLANAVKEKSVTCLECGKTFKILTKKHLETHDLTPLEYREKHGLKKNAPLVCKSLQRERRRKMKDMRLWEKRHQAAEPQS